MKKLGVYKNNLVNFYLSNKDKIGEENLKKLNQIRDDLINDKIKIQ